MKLRVSSVHGVNDGVIIELVQEKMQVPVAQENTQTDEARILKKLQQGMKSMGIVIDMREYMDQQPNTPQRFRTGLWFSLEDYADMGKPTVGDVLKFSVTKEEE